MKRTFIAVRVEPSEELKEAIFSLRNGLRMETVKWVDISNMHVTIAFIGNTEEEAVKAINSMLDNEFSGFGNISFELLGFGVFRNLNDPRIIFTDIENYGNLIEAHNILKKGLESMEIKLEARTFRPHLTIGRIKDIKDKNNLQELVQKFAGRRLQDINVSEIVYYESILLASGPIYKPISIIKLN